MPPSRDMTDHAGTPGGRPAARILTSVVARRIASWCDARARRDAGSASLEFLVATAVLLIPIVYLVLAVSVVQAASLGVESAARHGARVFVQADDPSEADAAFERAVQLTLADYGVDDGGVEVSIACAPEPTDCFDRGSLVTVRVGTAVQLPLFPALLGIEAASPIVVDASSTQQRSLFRSAP